MKISLITVCYNSEKTIEDTLKSVLAQKFSNYEYWIIDGASKDQTMDIVKQYEPKFKGKMKWISEKDHGLYDAMNKGIRNATGDIIGIINSDDMLADSKVLKVIAETFERKKCDGTYGNLQFRDRSMTKVNRNFKAKPGNYKLGWYPPHPTLYLRKEVFQKHGVYNQEYRIAADYDLMLRVLKDRKLKLEYIDTVLVYMRSGGVSTNGFKGYWRSFQESYQVLKNNDIHCALFVNGLRTIRILKQVLSSKEKKK